MTPTNQLSTSPDSASPDSISHGSASVEAGRPPDVIDELLARVLDGTRPAQLVVFGLSAGLPKLVRAAEASRVVAADRNLVHARAAAEAVRGMPHVSVLVSEGTSHLEGIDCASAIALRVPREKQPGLQLLWDAYHLLEPGGKLYLAGANRDGIKSYLQHAADLFGGVHTAAIRHGCRVGVTVRPPGAAPRPAAFTSDLLDHSRYHTFRAAVRGKNYIVRSRPGVFSWDRLDGGTRALIETMRIEAADRALDIGCGSGLVGVVASDLARQGSATMVDADIVAVESARRTVAANGRPNCEVLFGDGAADLEPDSFDAVAVNPPFHLDRKNDYRTAQRFIQDTARVLRPGGRLFLVANRFLPYEVHLREAFGSAEKAFEDRSYKVLAARKAAANG